MDPYEAIPYELQAAALAVKQAVEREAEARAELRVVIERARALGYTLREIAEHADMSHTRVAQILHGEEED